MPAVPLMKLRDRLSSARAVHTADEGPTPTPLTAVGFLRLVLVAVALFVLGGVPTAAVARSRPVQAKPKIAYASFWGGSGAEGCGPTRGADGSLYVACGTDSPNLPRVGGIQSYQGQGDGYVAKLDRTGKHIVYATYLGSPGQDQIQSAAVDARGHLYISGFAASGFPTTPGAYDTTFNGAADCCDGSLGDAFVAELSADGSRLLYSTFIGGSSAEAAGGLALNHDGSVVITGFTGSADFPTTPGAVGSTFHGGAGTFQDVPADAFAARLNPRGSRLVYSTYLGGSADDAGNSVALDDAGNAYYTGFTASPEFPTTLGAVKTSLDPGTTLNGYVTTLDPAGRMKWSTYLGGNGRDSAWGIDVDSSHHVYVSGSTIGGFPVTAGAVQGTFGGERDWFNGTLKLRSLQTDVEQEGDDVYRNAYGYATFRNLARFDLTAGLAFEDVDHAAGLVPPRDSFQAPSAVSVSDSQVSPKLGVSFQAGSLHGPARHRLWAPRLRDRPGAKPGAHPGGRVQPDLRGPRRGRAPGTTAWGSTRASARSSSPGVSTCGGAWRCPRRAAPRRTASPIAAARRLRPWWTRTAMPTSPPRT